LSFALTFLIMLAFWILLSGQFHFILLASGVVSSLFVAYISHDLLMGKVDTGSFTIKTYRLFKYMPWLLRQIVVANFDLVYRTLHPGMKIDPQVIKFKTDLKTDKGIAILANSITLTPGTVTVVANKDGEFIVHAIAKGPADSLLSGQMQARVKDIEGY
jgi:multicomponent Na+:H+ antiporter subunit E